MDGNNQSTLRTYEEHADRYIERTPATTPPAVATSLTILAERLSPGAQVLEIGSGPGRDAAFLERLGVRVHRSDATVAFVDHLRAQGHEAKVLNVINDALGGPYDGIMAMAVLQHLDRDDFRATLIKIAASLSPDGLLLFSMLDGEGDQWSENKMDAPRHFVYWSESQLVEAQAAAGMEPVQIWRRRRPADRRIWITFLSCVSHAR